MSNVARIYFQQTRPFLTYVWHLKCLVLCQVYYLCCNDKINKMKQEEKWPKNKTAGQRMSAEVLGSEASRKKNKKKPLSLTSVEVRCSHFLFLLRHCFRPSIVAILKRVKARHKVQLTKLWSGLTHHHFASPSVGARISIFPPSNTWRGCIPWVLPLE